MTQNLKPGDICIVIASACLTEHGRKLIGTECSLRMAAPNGASRHPDHATFVVGLPDGEETVLCSACLKKRQPPEATVSWNAIQQISGWRPRQAEHARQKEIAKTILTVPNPLAHQLEKHKRHTGSEF